MANNAPKCCLCTFQVTTLAAVQCGNGGSTSRSCRKPTNESLLAQLANETAYSYDIHEHLVPSGGHFDNRRCSESVDVDWYDGKSRPLNERSLCPWIVEVDERNDRFPPAIAVARCVCRRCQVTRSSHQCRPIYRPMIVLLKTYMCDERNLIIYRPVKFMVTIGCTCVDASQ